VIKLGAVKSELVGDRELVRLVVHGHVPGKKDALRPGGARGKKGFHYSPDVKQKIVEAAFQLRVQWGGRPPVLHPELHFKPFFNGRASRDRDGLWTAILDCMVEAGILFDDSAEYCNGTETHLPAEFAPEDRCELSVIFPKGAVNATVRARSRHAAR
jgi:hypothetical protein